MAPGKTELLSREERSNSNSTFHFQPPQEEGRIKAVSAAFLYTLGNTLHTHTHTRTMNTRVSVFLSASSYHNTISWRI